MRRRMEGGEWEVFRWTGAARLYNNAPTFRQEQHDLQLTSLYIRHGVHEQSALGFSPSQELTSQKTRPEINIVD